MQVEHIDSLPRLLEIEVDWDELYRRDPHSSLYLSSAFIGSIAARTAGKFRILAAWSDDGRLDGVLPLLVTTRWNKAEQRLHNVLEMLGHVFDADYTGIVCEPEQELEVCRAFAAEIAAMPFARLVLSFFSGSRRRLEAFTDAFDASAFIRRDTERKINDGRTNNLLCPAVELPGDFSAYLDGLSAGTRQKLRRLLRQLDADPGLRITRSRPETYEQDAAILSELWFLQYAGRKGQKRADKLARQFRHTVMIGLASGMIHLAILWREQRPVAAHAIYVDPVKRHALFHVGARDERVRDLATGLLLHAHSIRWSIAQGLTRYDFTLGDEPYKYSFGAVDREIFSVEIATPTGLNTTGRLDPACRDDALEHIRRYMSRGRRDDALSAARQALDVWPELSADGDIEAFLARITSGAQPA